MIVKAIYHGLQQVGRVYHNGQIIFQSNSPIEFHVIDGDKLIIVGAKNAREWPDGVYLDCIPSLTVDWTAPLFYNNVLTIEQVYSATPNGNVLEVE